MSYKIYHNTRCRKSRAGLKYLEEKGIKPEIIEYLKNDAFTVESLTEVIKKLGSNLRKLFELKKLIINKTTKARTFRMING